MSTLKLYKDRLYEHVTTGLFRGWLPSVQPPIEKLDAPSISWHGSLMPFRLWCQAVTLSRASYAKNKSECQWKFLYNEATQGWEIVVMPQEAVGMSTKEIANHTDREAIISDYMARGFQIVGTGHHHCTASAFQSGTDSHDEEHIPGFHFTIGYVDKKTIDIHMRITFRGDQYDIPKDDIPAWFDVPMPIGLQADLHDVVRHHLVFNPPQVDIPAEWLDRIEEKRWGMSDDPENDYIRCADGIWRRRGTLSLAEREQYDSKKADRVATTSKNSGETTDSPDGDADRQELLSLTNSIEFQAMPVDDQQLLRVILASARMTGNNVTLPDIQRVVQKGCRLLKYRRKRLSLLDVHAD